MRITDFKMPLIILNDPVIKSEIYEDGASLDIPDLVHEYWLSAHLGHDIIGCFRYHPMGAVMWQVHVRILPKYRQKWAKRATKESYIWCYKNIPRIEKIMAFIPAIHTNVVMHAKVTGMTKDGVIEKSYLKGGKTIDQFIYSISTEKIETFYGGELCQPSQ